MIGEACGLRFDGGLELARNLVGMRNAGWFRPLFPIFRTVSISCVGIGGCFRMVLPRMRSAPFIGQSGTPRSRWEPDYLIKI